MTLPVSRFAAIGNASTISTTVVQIGRRRYAQSAVHSSSRIDAPRQTNQAISHGSSAHGVNRGSSQGA